MLTGPRRVLDWALDPLEAVRRWPSDRGLVVLHSGRTDARWSRWSVLAEPALEAGVDWELGQGASVTAGFVELERRVSADDGLWVGFLGYDVGYGLERIGRAATLDHGWPLGAMRRCGGWLLHDRVSGVWSGGGDWSAGEGMPDLPGLEAVDGASRFGAGEVTAEVSRAAYLAKLRRCLAYIAAGDVFQVNLTQRLGAEFVGDPRGLFVSLAEASPAWYGAYAEWPAGRDRKALSLVSTSPELFFELGDDGRVVTRPIKGTRPIDAPAEALADSAKDRAELAMIVDLLRNDLGRVCGYGSVRVDEARVIERHPTVQHGVATVSGRLHGSRGLADLLRALMPGGSITGAPKVRAMQVIDELEAVRRGPYCGAVGWLQGGGAEGLGIRGGFNLAIRTALVEQPALGERGRVTLGVGGGIVADSEPEAEYEETWVKARALVSALAAGRMGWCDAGADTLADRLGRVSG